MTIFAQGVVYLEGHGVDSLNDASPAVSAFLEAPSEPIFARDEQEHQALRRLMPQVSSETWNALDATAKPTKESQPDVRPSPNSK
jgi:hypothetical protein